MGKSTAAKSKPQEEPLVNAFAAQHGDYGKTTISVTAGEFADEPYHKQRQVTVNRGGSTVQRWISSGSLTEQEVSAISHYSRAWHRVYSEPRVTANLSPIAFIRTTGDEAARNAAMIDARELLDFLDERIFDIAPAYYKGVWQDIVIFDRPAYEVGGKTRASADRAKTICLFISDMIATVLRL
jgi:hypothetical protein